MAFACRDMPNILGIKMQELEVSVQSISQNGDNNTFSRHEVIVKMHQKHPLIW